MHTHTHTHTLAGPHPLWILLPMTLLLTTMTSNIQLTKPKTKARKIVKFQGNYPGYYNRKNGPYIPTKNQWTQLT